MDGDGSLDLLTPEEVGKRFHFSSRTIRFFAQTRQIPAIKLGRAWRFRQVDLEKLLVQASQRNRDK